jgi:hypothetical protein
MTAFLLPALVLIAASFLAACLVFRAAARREHRDHLAQQARARDFGGVTR